MAMDKNKKTVTGAQIGGTVGKIGNVWGPIVGGITSMLGTAVGGIFDKGSQSPQPNRLFQQGGGIDPMEQVMMQEQMQSQGQGVNPAQGSADQMASMLGGESHEQAEMQGRQSNPMNGVGASVEKGEVLVTFPDGRKYVFPKGQFAKKVEALKKQFFGVNGAREFDPISKEGFFREVEKLAEENENRKQSEGFINSLDGSEDFVNSTNIINETEQNMQAGQMPFAEGEEEAALPLQRHKQGGYLKTYKQGDWLPLVKQYSGKPNPLSALKQMAEGDWLKTMEAYKEGSITDEASLQSYLDSQGIQLDMNNSEAFYALNAWKEADFPNPFFTGTSVETSSRVTPLKNPSIFTNLPTDPGIVPDSLPRGNEFTGEGIPSTDLNTDSTNLDTDDSGSFSREIPLGEKGTRLPLRDTPQFPIKSTPEPTSGPVPDNYIQQLSKSGGGKAKEPLDLPDPKKLGKISGATNAVGALAGIMGAAVSKRIAPPPIVDPNLLGYEPVRMAERQTTQAFAPARTASTGINNSLAAASQEAALRGQNVAGTRMGIDAQNASIQGQAAQQNAAMLWNFYQQDERGRDQQINMVTQGVADLGTAVGVGYKDFAMQKENNAMMNSLESSDFGLARNDKGGISPKYKKPKDKN